MSILRRLRNLPQSAVHIAQQTFFSQRFRHYQHLRRQRFGMDLSALRTPGRPGLVSIVLPVFNGADLMSSAILSICAQTYSDWELVIINDGSNDNTAELAEHFAARDPRIRVFHQENRKIPRTLSRGFRLADGEFFTWTSADNRLKPDFLSRFVDCFHRHPDWDVAFANQDLIGEDGLPLRNSDYYCEYQTPKGSEHIYLPQRTDMLHSAGNLVGGAFMYRSRAAHILGDYSPFRFTVEDYDYWLLADTLLGVHHVDFLSPVYEYRFHSGSLTSRAKELRIREATEKLLAWDRFRQDYCLLPLYVVLDASAQASDSPAWLDVKQQLRNASHRVISLSALLQHGFPTTHATAVYLRADLAAACRLPPPSGIPKGVLSAFLLCDQESTIPTDIHPDWDVVLALGPGDVPHLGTQDTRYQGLWRSPDSHTLVRALDCRARVEALRTIETQTASAKS